MKKVLASLCIVILVALLGISIVFAYGSYKDLELAKQKERLIERKEHQQEKKLAEEEEAKYVPEVEQRNQDVYIANSVPQKQAANVPQNHQSSPDERRTEEQQVPLDESDENIELDSEAETTPVDGFAETMNGRSIGEERPFVGEDPRQSNIGIETLSQEGE
ncbi:hypothetical protein DOS77_01740 [Staphylococcus felis]|uniref:hypothetical protein n=1 Tax=Staphylococcus felis TaxID=46127 RepID=UPI000E260DA3|nr:hypothetical protein [Staphylococcus felis]REH79195.1 hypothetical protein DOS57_03510 [Staphylococcus felis]REH94193.1 hypothetical protein DOS67_09625 [Staphylococcus felis]REI03442.1 hypothetical protein DOS62_08285 [Staphylococcus felis]REI10949.1 hypothetical protein DOS73_11700 [Staphylococcus felis]REI24765.1 hypothetical protein DOS77_01740 [Staphylococcus felis]